MCSHVSAILPDQILLSHGSLSVIVYQLETNYIFYIIWLTVRAMHELGIQMLGCDHDIYHPAIFPVLMVYIYNITYYWSSLKCPYMRKFVNRVWLLMEINLKSFALSQLLTKLNDENPLYRIYTGRVMLGNMDIYFSKESRIFLANCKVNFGFHIQNMRDKT